VHCENQTSWRVGDVSAMSAATQAQVDAIFAELSAGRSLTPQDALCKFQCFRLAARIYDLRCRGHDIATIWESGNGKRWARYAMIASA
jgi:hypothetical protein